jgi:hypothetical protein
VVIRAKAKMAPAAFWIFNEDLSFEDAGDRWGGRRK